VGRASVTISTNNLTINETFNGQSSITTGTIINYNSSSHYLWVSINSVQFCFYWSHQQGDSLVAAFDSFNPTVCPKSPVSDVPQCISRKSNINVFLFNKPTSISSIQGNYNGHLSLGGFNQDCAILPESISGNVSISGSGINFTFLSANYGQVLFFNGSVIALNDNGFVSCLIWQQKGKTVDAAADFENTFVCPTTTTQYCNSNLTTMIYHLTKQEPGTISQTTVVGVVVAGIVVVGGVVLGVWYYWNRKHAHDLHKKPTPKEEEEETPKTKDGYSNLPQ